MIATPTERVFAALAGYGPAATDRGAKALDFASQTLRGRFRYNGEPHIMHALAVAATIADLGGDSDTIVAALLHSGPVAPEPVPVERIRAEFRVSVGDVLADFLELHHFLMHLELIPLNDLNGVDPRAVLLTVVHRLHGMQTIQCLEKAIQQRKADQTRELIIPIAHNFGLGSIATELDGLATAILGRPDTRVIAQPSARGFDISHRVLFAAAYALLPGYCQDRWLAEWDAELEALPRCRDKLGFALSLLLGLPSMAVLARRSRHIRDGVDR